MKVACIIQARLASTRLPAKTLLMLPTGRCVLEEVIHRCRQIKGVDVVVVAIPDSQENDIVAEIAGRTGVSIVRGSEHDVLSRYIKAAEAVNADLVLRVTSDCPLIEPFRCSKVIANFITADCDYVANNFEPRSVDYGGDCEVFSIDALRRANADATEPSDREHVGTWMRNNLRALASSYANRSGWTPRRLTLDTLADYKVIWDEFKRREKEAA